jgi:hypothetical protein
MAGQNDSRANQVIAKLIGLKESLDFALGDLER